jgi:hypothetical protein
MHKQQTYASILQNNTIDKQKPKAQLLEYFSSLSPVPNPLYTKFYKLRRLCSFEMKSIKRSGFNLYANERIGLNT